MIRGILFGLFGIWLSVQATVFTENSIAAVFLYLASAAWLYHSYREFKNRL